MKSLTPFPYEEISVWIDWVKRLEPILTGTAFAKLLREKNSSVCMPECTQMGFWAKKVYLPDMLLRNVTLPTPYDIDLEHCAMCLITGPNHSGKTTFLKTIAQCIIFAQLGFPIPAEEFRFAPVSSIHTLFSSGEENEVSRFEREAIEMHRILSDADRQSAVFYNEPYTTTAPGEAAELLYEAFCTLRKKNVVQYAVTHLYDIYEPLRHTFQDSLVSYTTIRTTENGLHCYQPEKRPPDPTGYAYQIAAEFGLCAASLLRKKDLIGIVQQVMMRDGSKAGSEETTCL